jgi:hypothetical protein
MDQNLWGNENFRRSMGRVDKWFEKKPFESLLSVLFKFLPKLKYARTFISVIGIFA